MKGQKTFSSSQGYTMELISGMICAVALSTSTMGVTASLKYAARRQLNKKRQNREKRSGNKEW